MSREHNEGSTSFSSEEWHRYTRHIQLGKFGVKGQSALKQAHIVIIGAGGLGCPASQYLAAAGVGKITLVDADVVSRTNLQRQVLFAEADIGIAKVQAAAEKLAANNPYIHIETHTAHLNAENATALLADADLVLDCCDNFACRYLINDTCLALGKPWIFASIGDYSGQLALFTPETACFRCLFPNTPKNAVDCNSAGVLGVLPGQLGVMQATVALQYLAKLPGLNPGKLILVEALYQEVRQFSLQVASDCRCQQASMPVPDDAEQAQCLADQIPDNVNQLLPAQFTAQRSQFHVLDVRQTEEFAAYGVGGDCIPFDADNTAGFIESVAAQFDTEQALLLLCQSGVRSQKAAKALADHGYRHIASLRGGIAGLLQWQFED